VIIFFCRGCERYQKPPWVVADFESKELMALCLKKVKGLNKNVKLITAKFKWTEPHSRRIKIELTVQKEVYNQAILQQSFITEFVVQAVQCPDCARSYTEHTWNSVVQVRQHVKHKRTFFYLEQLLLRHQVCVNAIGMKEQPDGLDFYWDSKPAAVRQMQFLQSVVPTRIKQSKRLISQDDSSNTKNYKHSLFVEITPICKDDLVCLHPKLCQELGGISPLMICYKVTGSLHFIDPISLKHVDVSASKYWQYPFTAIMSASQLIEYTVLDVEKSDSFASKSKGKDQKKSAAGLSKASKLDEKLALAEVKLARSSDFGVNDATVRCLTHLGNVLHAGDLVLCYDMEKANLPDVLQKDLAKRKKDLPEVIIVRKAYRRKGAPKRKWKLKQLAKDAPDRSKKDDAEKAADEYEQFLRDLEEDPEMRKNISLYKTDAKADAKKDAMEEEEDDEAQKPPEIPMDELIDELSERLSLGSSAPAAAAPSGEPKEDEAEPIDFSES